jgi:hypothetical protein
VQLKALAGYGLKGQITMKGGNGQVFVLADVSSCGLNSVNGSRGTTERWNVLNYAGACGIPCDPALV